MRHDRLPDDLVLFASLWSHQAQSTLPLKRAAHLLSQVTVISEERLYVPFNPSYNNIEDHKMLLYSPSAAYMGMRCTSIRIRSIKETFVMRVCTYRTG